ncbi:MAG TPA: SGNH/GDSL hydrolase family protein [Caldilinea sp.]|nr:SGNH/GDSL hydrolase family protein [Caldilinea sp.]
MSNAAIHNRRQALKALAIPIAFLGANSALAHASRVHLDSAAPPPAPTAPTPPLIILIGNSITDTLGLFAANGDAVQPWYWFANQDVSVGAVRAAWAMTAVRGYDLSGIVARIHPQMIAPLLSSWRGQRVAFVWEGTNELVQTRNAQVCWQRHIAYCDSLRAAGAQVVVGTILKRSYVWDGWDYEAARNEFNTLVRAEWSQHADAMMDVGADITLGETHPPPDPEYWVDHSHPATAGQRIIASYAANALRSVFSAPATLTPMPTPGPTPGPTPIPTFAPAATVQPSSETPTPTTSGSRILRLNLPAVAR